MSSIAGHATSRRRAPLSPRGLRQGNEGLPRYAYLPFGAGPRACIGGAYALFACQIVLEVVLRDVRLGRQWTQPIAAAPLMTLRPAGPLPVTVIGAPMRAIMPDLVEDAHLADAMVPQACAAPSAAPSHVLLTGVTGFLGSEIAVQLLTTTYWQEVIARKALALAKFAHRVCLAEADEASGSVDLRFQHNRRYDNAMLRRVLG